MKLYTSSEVIAKKWEKEYPGVEIILTPKKIPTHIHIDAIERNPRPKNADNIRIES